MPTTAIFFDLSADSVMFAESCNAVSLPNIRRPGPIVRLLQIGVRCTYQAAAGVVEVMPDVWHLLGHADRGCRERCRWRCAGRHQQRLWVGEYDV